MMMALPETVKAIVRVYLRITTMVIVAVPVLVLAVLLLALAMCVTGPSRMSCKQW